MALGPHPFQGLSSFRQALRRFLAASELISRAGGVTQQQYQAMLALKATTAGDLPIKGLAEELLLTHYAAVQLADRLCRAGLAERRPSQEDRRSVRLGLTPKGGALVDDLAARHLTEILRQAPQLTRALQQLKRSARSESPASPDPDR